MFCEKCASVTPCVKRVIRITKDGREITIETCEFCLTRTEIEYFKKTKQVKN